jgi:hypothetical protein
MHRAAAVWSLLVMLGGCASQAPLAAPIGEPIQMLAENPVFLPGTNHEFAWETLVDVVDDYFQVAHEEPMRLLGNVLTEGRLETLPEVGATLFEPWRRDSVGSEQRLESTLQSIRRYAQVRAIPAEGGFWFEVAVFKELEDVVQPENSTAGAAIFRNDSSLVRVESPVGEQEINRGWIPLGRDSALEQEMIAELQARYGSAAVRAIDPRVRH